MPNHIFQMNQLSSRGESPKIQIWSLLIFGQMNTLITYLPLSLDNRQPLVNDNYLEQLLSSFHLHSVFLLETQHVTIEDQHLKTMS
jgi:hypothetical protein